MSSIYIGMQALLLGITPIGFMPLDGPPSHIVFFLSLCTQALLLGITPIDFMPLDGPVAALFDLIALPLLIFFSLKLVPTEVSAVRALHLYV